MESTPRPLRRDAEANRRRILEAARAVFARDGFEAAMEEVARVAGCGIGTLYRRFPNKEALVRAQYAELVADLYGIVERASAEPDAFVGLERMLSEFGRRMAENRSLHEAFAGWSQLSDATAATRVQLMPRIEALLERAQASGQVREDLSVGDLTIMVKMLSVAVIVTEEASEPLWTRYVALLLDALRPGGPTLPLRAPSGEEVDRMIHAAHPSAR